MGRGERPALPHPTLAVPSLLVLDFPFQLGGSLTCAYLPNCPAGWLSMSMQSLIFKVETINLPGGHILAFGLYVGFRFQTNKQTPNFLCDEDSL